jgi:hypothetical protein
MLVEDAGIVFNEKEKELYEALGITAERAKEIVKGIDPPERVSSLEELAHIDVEMVKRTLAASHNLNLTVSEIIWFMFHVGEGIGRTIQSVEMEMKARAVAQFLKQTGVGKVMSVGPDGLKQLLEGGGCGEECEEGEYNPEKLDKGSVPVDSDKDGKKKKDKSLGGMYG